MIDLGSLRSGQVLDTPEGPTFVRTAGKGAPVFVIHGGPGWDHGYLRADLEFVARHRTLVFYDQPGCGRTPAPDEPITPEQTFRHFRALAALLTGDRTAGVIAHSWGALVFIASRALPLDDAVPATQFTEGVLINPVPLSAERFGLARRALIKRVPLLRLLKIYGLYFLNADGHRIVRNLVPYYGIEDTNMDVAQLSVSTETYKTMFANLGDYDHTGSVGGLENFTAIFGEDDYAGPRLVSEIMDNVGTIEVLEDAGHFPFCESPDHFRAAVERAFG